MNKCRQVQTAKQSVFLRLVQVRTKAGQPFETRTYDWYYNKTPVELDQPCMKEKRKTTRVSEGSSYRARLQNLICPIKN